MRNQKTQVRKAKAKYNEKKEHIKDNFEKIKAGVNKRCRANKESEAKMKCFRGACPELGLNKFNATLKMF